MKPLNSTLISAPAQRQHAPLRSMLAISTALVFGPLSLTGCASKTATLEAPGLVRPQPNKVECPAMALAPPEAAPEPPAGVSLDAVMAALGKDGWQWLWAYKEWAEEGQSRIADINATCTK